MIRLFFFNIPILLSCSSTAAGFASSVGLWVDGGTGIAVMGVVSIAWRDDVIFVRTVFFVFKPVMGVCGDTDVDRL